MASNILLSLTDLLCALSLIIQLVVVVASTAPVAAAAALKREDCNPKPCGELIVRYPFWLSGEQPSECGYPSFNVTCSGNRTASLNFFDSNYRVNDIFYHNQSLVLSASQFADNSCRLPYYNLTSDNYPLFNSASNKRIIFFLNCTSSKNSSQFHQVDCALYGRPAFYGGEYDPSSDQPNSAGLGGCVPAVVPVVNYSNTSRDANYTVPLRDGWLMNWNVQNCTECFDSGGACGYENSTASFICICDDRNHKGTCNDKNSGNRNGIVIAAGVITLTLLAIVLFCMYKKKHKYSASSKSLMPDDSFGTNMTKDSEMNKSNARLSKKIKSTIIGVAALASSSLLCLFLLLRLQRYKRSHPKQMQKKIEVFLNEHASSLATKRYKYSQVKKMTEFFRSKLGQGGYGTVYKGALRDGRFVAVKVLTDSKGDGEEFVNEVASISRTSHVNIVSLVGFCVEGSKRVLIYDFMPNGSLDKFISFDHEGITRCCGPSLDWQQLHQIAVGIARGLEYLHRGCNTRIVHLDIKPHNILLDEDFCPKIADFGLAKLGRPKESRISMTGARGTIGYIAPEVFSRNFGPVSSKSDVYSYGMMVLEMVGAKRRIKTDGVVVGSGSSSSDVYFPQCIYDNLDEYCDVEEKEMNSSSVVQFDEGSREMVRRMIIVGLWCIQMVPANRPTMTTVLDMLQGNEDLEMPPRP